MRGLKKFGITFAVSFVILGVVALFVCGYVADTVCGIFNGDGKDIDKILAEDPEDASDGSEDRFKRKIDGESYTWLWVVSDYRPNVFDDYYPSNEAEVEQFGDDEFGILGKNYRRIEASNIILVRADVKTRSYVIVAIPKSTKIAIPGGTATLSQMYALEGIEGLKGKVEALTGLTVDYYSVIHSTNLSAIANAAGSIECTIPVEIFTDGKNYVSAKATAETTETAKNSDKDKSDAAETPKYENELDAAESVSLANKLMPALLYYDTTDGIEQEMTIEKSFADGLMKNLSDESDSGLSSILQNLGGYFVANNVTTDSIRLSGEVVRAYSWFEVKLITYPGKLINGKSDNAYFNPDIDSAVSMLYDYR